MRVGEHGIRPVGDGAVAEGLDDDAQFGQPDVPDRLADRHGVREVIDVFARAREVRELGDAREPEGGELVANEVFDGLHVVARDGFVTGEFVDLGLPEFTG